jgi:hypothetical protein
MQPLVVQDGDYSASLGGTTFDEALVLEVSVRCAGDVRIFGRRSCEAWCANTTGYKRSTS